MAELILAQRTRRLEEHPVKGSPRIVLHAGGDLCGQCSGRILHAAEELAHWLSAGTLVPLPRDPSWEVL